MDRITVPLPPCNFTASGGCGRVGTRAKCRPAGVNAKIFVFGVRRKKEVNAEAEFRPPAADPLRYPPPQNRKVSRRHRLRFRFPGNAIVLAARFSPAWIRAGWQKNR